MAEAPAGVPSLRIGHGMDAHRYGEGDEVVVGGVSIPFGRGVVAHSDGDVLIHALCNALLGALGLGDIGVRFPPTDPRFEDAGSRELLRDVHREVAQLGWQVVNVDATIIAQVPKMARYVEAMCAHLSADLHVSPAQVNVKATTTENMGYIGREEGLASHVVVLLARS